MNTGTKSGPTLDDRIKKLEEYIARNPHSSTLQKEELEDLKKERQKQNRTKDGKHEPEEILY